MEKTVRILHILQRMEAGGTQALLMNLYRNIDRTKIQFDFLVEYPDKQFYDDEILSMGGRIFYSNVRNDKNIFRFQKQLGDILRKYKYQIVHVHAFTIGYFCLRTAHKCGVPVRIAHSHNNETVRDSKYLLKRIMQKLYPIYATDLFACSKEAGKYLFHSKKFHVLNNAIDSSKFTANPAVRDDVRKELRIGDRIAVGHVGRFHAQKNHDFLLDVFAGFKKKHSNSVLILVGSGDLENQIREKISALGLDDSVMLLGNRKDMNRIYQAMDIFLLPSLFEGLGIVAVEAQAAGIPVIASDGVSLDAKVSPLIHYVKLSRGASEWSEAAEKALKSEYCHKNMQKYIIKSGFDVKSTAGFLQNFYIKKSGMKQGEV